MKHKALFNEKIYYDETSPTKLRFRRNDKPAGTKVEQKGGYSHWAIVIKIPKSGKLVNWSVSRLLFEVYHGYEPPDEMYICAIDGNKDNFAKGNLALFPCSRGLKKMKKEFGLTCAG